MTKGTKEWTGRPVTLNRMLKKGLTSKESNLGLSDLEILLSQNQGKEKEPSDTRVTHLFLSICFSSQCLQRLFPPRYFQTLVLVPRTCFLCFLLSVHNFIRPQLSFSFSQELKFLKTRFGAPAISSPKPSGLEPYPGNYHSAPRLPCPTTLPDYRPPEDKDYVILTRCTEWMHNRRTDG